MPTGPKDKWDQVLDISSYTNPADVNTALSNAWDAYHTANGVYPNVYLLVGTKVLYGSY